MDKEYFSSINDVSKRLSVPAHTLRYWEKQFPAAIRPTTGAGGRRYYRADTVARLMTIKDLLYNRGMTIAGVKKMLREGQFAMAGDDITSPEMQSATRAQTNTTRQHLDPDTVDLLIDLLTQAKQQITNS